MKKIGVFCDVSNLYYCVSHRFEGRKLDYRKYLAFIQDLGDIQYAYAYGSQMKGQAHAFVAALKGAGFIPKFKSPKEIQGKVYKRKADWDVGIAIDMIKGMTDLDTMILGSADSDMAPAVEYVREQNVKVIVFACGVSRELHDLCDVLEIPESLLENR